jgi:Mrp family chromosome partitioning ATPase
MYNASPLTSKREQEDMTSHEQRLGGNDPVEERSNNDRRSTELVQLRRPIRELAERGTHIDGNYVAPHFYDCFNYSLLTDGSSAVNIAVGVTSPNPQEGKTLVACNLAVSLTIAHQKKTILVDLNLREPRLHKIFGVPASPGLLEGMGDGAIHVAPTSVNGLYVLSAGVASGRFVGLRGDTVGREDASAITPEAALQLEQVAAFRDVVYSLKERFDFVIVDLPAVNEYLLPLLFANQLDGTLLVIQGGRTKQAEIDRALQMLNEHRVLGFVYNGVERSPVQRRRKR